MKIRITGNKIRARLKEPEIQRLYEGVPITETLEFGGLPDQQLKFRLETYDRRDLGITYQTGCVLIQIPVTFSQVLVSTDRIGYDGDVQTAHGAGIYLLIEKDFERLDATEDDNEGSYPNPKQAC
jgi:hypothetical protein